MTFFANVTSRRTRRMPDHLGGHDVTATHGLVILVQRFEDAAKRSARDIRGVAGRLGGQLTANQAVQLGNW